MFDITKLALRIPNLLTKSECQLFIDQFDSRKDKFQESSVNANTGDYTDSTFKAVDITFENPLFKLAREKTKKAINLYTDYLDSSGFFHKGIRHALKYSHKYRVLRYGVGEQIHPHIDHNLGTYGSVTLNLNSDYKGGEFSFFNNNYSLSLKQGEALIFPADYFWVHEVLPVSKGARYSINSFIKILPETILDQMVQ